MKIVYQRSLLPAGCRRFTTVLCIPAAAAIAVITAFAAPASAAGAGGGWTHAATISAGAFTGAKGSSRAAGSRQAAAATPEAAAVPAPPAPPGGRIYGPFSSLAACERVLQKTQPPAGWRKACFQWDDGNWYIAVWPPQEEHQPTVNLNPWQYLISLSVNLVMQQDGNLVVYDDLTHKALWASNTVGSGAVANMQADGNFVVYNSARRAVWASNTCCRSDAWLQVQDDGNVVIYNGGHAIWATNTQGG